ncbi:MAG TPA: NAD(P)/FAD-dependent oxidoreductase [Candidatus Acidoferrales bacterium]|nr:NAD(P)/FAD-dependent oxidoreductase [Candidatus Acidoferrales bacterium]
MSASTSSNPRFLIIGAGMSGILSAIRLREVGLHNFAIYEKADRLGGTWRENTYPGIACDVPSHLYSYSFAFNPDWNQRFAAGAEIQAYFEDVARRYEVDKLIQYGKEIIRCERDDGRWKITMADGSTDKGDFVIAATGVLHHPSYPDIAGLDSFAGAKFHSARWNHSVALQGKRIAVIGTGSSAIQIVGALVDRVAHLSLFQRTPQWIAPTLNSTYSEAEKINFREHPEAIDALRAEVSYLFIEGFANHLANVDSMQLQMIHQACVTNLEDNVKDLVLREKLRPSYRAGCKRLIMSENFYEAIQRPNATLVTEPIKRVEPAGIRTSDGKLHEIDVLVLATGFRVDRFMRPMQVCGRNGVRLDEVWNRGPHAYMAISVPDFPNLFMLNGPNAPVGNFSLIEVAELQFSYILQLIDQARGGGCKELSASHDAMDRFDRERREAAKSTIWNSGCKSWYLDESGLPTAWPWTFDRFREEMSRPRLVDFEIK